MADNYVCWKCGANISHMSFPIGRMDKCEACKADLHVCKLCKFYDKSRANQCQEPIADPVNDKRRSNFCGYFEVRIDAYQQADSSEVTAAQQELAALFGEPVEIKDSDSIDPKSELENLFGGKSDNGKTSDIDKD